MGWSSKGFPLYLRSHKLPTTHKHSSRSGKGPLPASPNALDNPPPPREEMARASGCRRAIKLTRMAASRIEVDTHVVERDGKLTAVDL